MLYSWRGKTSFWATSGGLITIDRLHRRLHDRPPLGIGLGPVRLGLTGEQNQSKGVVKTVKTDGRAIITYDVTVEHAAKSCELSEQAVPLEMPGVGMGPRITESARLDLTWGRREKLCDATGP